MDTPVDTPMDVEPMDTEPVDEAEHADAEARTGDEVMPTFDVPDTAEELNDDFLAAPPEEAVDPDVAAIFDAVAGDEFAHVEGPANSDRGGGDAAEPLATEAHASVDTDVDDHPSERTEAIDPDAPLLNLPDAHDPDLGARIDGLVAGFQVRLDELIAELHAE